MRRMKENENERERERERERVGGMSIHLRTYVLSNKHTIKSNALYRVYMYV